MSARTTGRVRDKVVVVTGAARGQGAATATALAREGAHVIATDIVRPGDIPGRGDDRTRDSRITHHHLDVGDESSWTALAACLRDTHGHLDGLINNAGITWRARLGELTTADVTRVHAVNMIGPLLGIQSLSPLMPPGSSIVNIGSSAALTGHYPVAYTTSKWALRGLSAAVCLELGSRGIRVNTVHPGFIETPMTAAAPPSMRAATLTETPLGRVGTVEDIAPLMVFLMSDESSFISGAEIPVDGGYTAHGGAKSISDALRQTP